ncbi:MAG: DUF935 domain-containing protein [Rhodobacter sp.]|nr:DUF935 domain-containing protein [Rhodobacter sp.]
MTQLLDQYGRPVKLKDLTQLLAEPGITGVRQAFADTVASGLTPVKLAGILRSADQGDAHDYLILAEEMEERDPHYFAVLGSRKRIVSGVEPIVKPASESAADKKIADAVREHIVEHDGFTTLIEDMLDALGKGYSAVEIEWQHFAKEWVPMSFIWRNPRFFTFDRETGQEMRLLDKADPVDGLELRPFKFITHRPKLKSGLPIRGGLARVVAFTWMCKAYTLKDWMAFIETYGLPIRLGKYGPGATKEDVEKLFTAVANIGTDAAAVLPRSMEIEFEAATSAGTGDKIFENLARWGDEQVSKAVAGQTMTADDGSSMAQAQVHNDVRHDIAAADAKAVTGTLNRDLVKPFVDLNFGGQEAYPIVAIEIAEPEDLDMLMRNVFRMSSQGVRFKQSEIRAKLGFSDPEEGDEVTGTALAAVGANGVAMNSAETGPFDDLAEIEQAALADWEDVAQDLIGPVEEIIAAASSYEDAMSGLAAAVPGLPSSKLVETLVKATYMARGLGDARDA